MMNSVLILAILTVMTTGVFAQGRLSADETSGKPARHAHHNARFAETNAVVTAEGSASVGLGTWLFSDTLNQMTDAEPPPPVAQLRASGLTNAANLEEDAASDTDLGPAELPAPPAQAAVPTVNLRAWVYEPVDTSPANMSATGLALNPITTKTDPAAAGTGEAGNAGGGSTPSLEQEGLEILDEGGAQRQIATNISLPEPGTIGLTLMGGLMAAGRKWGRRRTGGRN